MARGMNSAVVGQLRTIFEVGAVGSMTDGELLDRFLDDLDHSGQAAFAALVERHGPMVLAVCRGILRTSHDREDAFQATFLVLARNARSIRNRDSIGPWLFGVARKVSVRARGNAARRLRGLEAFPAREAQEPDKTDRLADHELLMREVAHLPARLREPIVLCYWQGLTYDQSAEVLGVTEATVRGRLARAKDRLRTRLIRREISAESLAFGALNLGSHEFVPFHLIHPTIRAASCVAAGRTLTGIVSAGVIPLTEGAWSMIWIAKRKLAAATVLAVLGLLGLGTGVVAWQRSETRQFKPSTGHQFLIAEPVPAPKASATPSKDSGSTLENLVDGKIVRTEKVAKDCMVLAYLPDWNFGTVDNIGFEGHDGGVRTLVKWPDLPASEAGTEPLKFYLAFYSRKSVENSSPARKAMQSRTGDGSGKIKPGTIVALEILGEWPETTSWKTKPLSDVDAIGTYQFQPGDGWKIFDVTKFVRARQGRSGEGLMLRYLNEDRPGQEEWTGYQLVSREGADQWADKTPRLLVVDPSQK